MSECKIWLFKKIYIYILIEKLVHASGANEKQKDYGNNTDNYNNRHIIMNHVTLKTGVMAAENPAMHHRNKLILNIVK